MSVVLDTSFLYALADVSDRNHTRVLDVASSLIEPLILPMPVLPEVCYLLTSRLGHFVMRRFLDELVVSDTLLEPIDRADLRRVNELLEQYADSRLDFVDAAIIAIAERRDVTRVLTLDHRDFSMVRPRHCAHLDFPLRCQFTHCEEAALLLELAQEDWFGVQYVVDGTSKTGAAQPLSSLVLYRHAGAVPRELALSFVSGWAIEYDSGGGHKRLV
ncbi:MAG: PIN domain-containing protein [Anaerolineae bacterium]|nr:PIN domain-containing protein [Anaerolineae bacterium]